MDIAKEFETVEDGVRHLLANDTRCRNSDRWLLIRFWQVIDKLNVYIPFDKIDQWTPAETITRARRKIQEDGHLLPTDPKIMERRSKRSDEMRDYFARR